MKTNFLYLRFQRIRGEEAIKRNYKGNERAQPRGFRGNNYADREIMKKKGY